MRDHHAKKAAYMGRVLARIEKARVKAEARREKLEARKRGSGPYSAAIRAAANVFLSRCGSVSVAEIMEHLAISPDSRKSLAPEFGKELRLMGLTPFSPRVNGIQHKRYRDLAAWLKGKPAE